MNIRESLELREKQSLSPYASLSINTKGREIYDAPCTMRTDYQRDRDRILHCNSFRRLAYKTQVFLSPSGDHYRTRLTHTLEVSQVARTIARALNLNEDLTEAIALGHDLGHTPFGHAGEEVLNEISPHGYCHSEQSVRVVEVLERDGNGLNLTWEVRDGIAGHSNSSLGPANTREGQVVMYADKIAYMNHDIDDAVRAEVLHPDDIPLDIRHQLGRTKSERITSMVTDLVKNSGEEIKMSEGGKKLYNQLLSFMYTAVYTNPVAKSEEVKAKEVVRQLYKYFFNCPEKLPADFQERDDDIHRKVCDYISGMSDRFCVAIYEDLFIPKPWSV